MTHIKNIKLIEELISPSDLQKMDAGAAMHLHHSRIEFKVLDADQDAITVRVTQGKSPAENYLSAKELAARAKDLFGYFIPGVDIRARAIPYAPPSVEVVSPEWIQNQMREKGIDNKTIVEMTGVDKANISNWVSGKRPMSQPVKAMFYFMLK
ncbi:MAG: hypothetical protein KGZ74_00630 [Chitinophagaceae bacterium]|nr:hypothetical protein [Chitinophagaceae bacterium]